MVEINGFDIALTCGDSLHLRADLGGRDLPEGSKAVFTLKKTIRSRSNVVQKVFDAADEVVGIHLTPEETALPPGNYVWDVRLLLPLGEDRLEVYTPMKYASFVVLEAVGVNIVAEGEEEA